MLLNYKTFSLNMVFVFQLLKFLVMDPTKRVTSEVAMNDVYFTEEPRPSGE